MTEDSVEAHAEDIARAAYGKLLAMLAAQTGDIAAAEDALADAFVAALSNWPEHGVPDRPETWIMTVAKNRRIDRARRDRRLVITDEVPEMIDDTAPPDIDERLKMLFACANPSMVDAESQQNKSPELFTPERYPRFSQGARPPLISSISSEHGAHISGCYQRHAAQSKACPRCAMPRQSGPLRFKSQTCHRM